MIDPNNSMSRRDFIGAAAVGAAVLATGSIFKISAKDEKMAMPSKGIYVCSKCGHVEFGVAPENCPVCFATKDQYKENNTIFSDAISNYKDAGISHTPFISAKKKSSLITEAPTYEISVRIGKKLHPMEEAHHIQFLDCYIDDKYAARVSLSLSASPAATFYTKPAGAKIRIIELCSVHGYWQAEAVAA